MSIQINILHLLVNLQKLLEKQIEMARKGNLNSVEVLTEQADTVIEKIVRIKGFEQPEFDDRRRHLVKLYKKLELILSAGNASVEKQLQQINNVRKTLKAYRKNS